MQGVNAPRCHRRCRARGSRPGCSCPRRRRRARQRCRRGWWPPPAARRAAGTSPAAASPGCPLGCAPAELGEFEASEVVTDDLTRRFDKQHRQAATQAVHLRCCEGCQEPQAGVAGDCQAPQNVKAHRRRPRQHALMSCPPWLGAQHRRMQPRQRPSKRRHGVEGHTVKETLAKGELARCSSTSG